MRFRDQYDWIVLGTHPGALLSAALVARLGLSVLILPVGPSFTLSLMPSKSSNSDLTGAAHFYKSRGDDSGGQWIDPETNFLLGLGSSGKSEGVIYKSLKKLGMNLSQEDLIYMDRVTSQIVTPHYRLELSSLDLFQNELNRELGKSLTKNLGLIAATKATESISSAFWQNLPQRLTLPSKKKSTSVEPLHLKHLNRNFNKNLKSIGSDFKFWSSNRLSLSSLKNKGIESFPIETLLEGLWYSLLSSPANSESTPFDLIHFLGLQKTGARFRGGMSAYRIFLMELATQLGAQVVLKTECRRIFIDKGRFVGIQVASRGNVISAGGGVIGCSSSKALQKMTYSGAHILHRFKKPPQPIGWKFTIALTVRPELIPDAFQSRIVWHENDAPTLEMEVVDPADYQHSGNKNKILYIRTLLPYLNETLNPNYQKIIASRMFKKASEILPGLERHWIKIYPDFRYDHWESTLDKFGKGLKFLNTEFLKNSKDLENYYGFASLEAIPETLLIYEGKGFNYKTGIENLFIANMESYPKLGNLGPTQAGIEAAAWAAKKAGFAGPLVDK